MAGAKLKICGRCLDYLGVASELREDLASFMVATSSTGIEIVPVEECQPRLVCLKHTPGLHGNQGKGLGEVTEIELQSAIDKFISGLSLMESSREGVYDLRGAIYNEWLKALKDS